MCGSNEDKWMKKALAMLLGLLCTACGLCAQSDVPIISGTLGFLGTSSGGATFYQPLVVPVLAAPIGDHFLLESRGYIQEFVARDNGTSGPYNGHLFTGLDYLQIDYIANSHLTVSLGRFLTPFNIYNERFPIWIANLEDTPIIYTIGTRTTGSSDGAMVRGTAVARPNWKVDYTAYFSALATTGKFQSGRTAGGRAGLFLPTAGIELGVSYQRFLQNGDFNSSGFYATWQPPQIPLDVRTEYAHSPGGHGYWLEGAYRIAPDRNTSNWLSRLQTVARVQQYFKGNPTPVDILPGVDVKQFDFGLNYYLPHEVRINGSYGRQFRSTGNLNIWEFGITYRFLFPAWPGGHK
jgi:hypothetical protein